MKYLILPLTLLIALSLNAQKNIKNKNLDSPILFNDEIIYNHFKKFEAKMSRKGKYINPNKLDLYAIFINKGITNHPFTNKQKGLIYRSNSGNNIILLPNNSRKCKRKLYQLLKPLYHNKY